MNTQKNYKKLFTGQWLATLLILMMVIAVASCESCNRNTFGTEDTDADILPGADTVSPQLVETNPADGATDVPINRVVTASFSEDMEIPTINITTFTLTAIDGTPVVGTVDLDTTKRIATLTPDSDLEMTTTYTATVTTGAEDLSGNGLAIDYVWEFTTGDSADVTVPTVILTSPADGDTGVAVNEFLTASFSEEINPLTITTLSFTVIDADANPVTGSISFNDTNTIATFTPESDLIFDTSYTATITTDVQDLASNALEADYIWEFTTETEAEAEAEAETEVDTIAPEVTVTVPEDGAIDVSVNQVLSASFSESMITVSISASTFTVARPDGTLIAGAVDYTLAGSIATFTPDIELEADTTYTATITTGAEDLANNALEADYIWEFTTAIVPETTPPTVISTNPADNDDFVAINKTITATFDEPMLASTITTDNFTITDPDLNSISGVVEYDALTDIASFNPDVNLAPNTVFTALLTTAVTDLAGNGLELDYEWIFTTGTDEAQVTVQESIDLGSSSNFAILAAAAISNLNPPSAITGDVGLNPGTGAGITGFSEPLTCPEVTGTIYAVDAAGPGCAVNLGAAPNLISDAQEDALVAYDDALNVARGTAASISGDLNGLTLYPGLYESTDTILISTGGKLYLDAQGDENAVFVIRGTSDMSTSTGSEVVLTKGAQAKNVFWTAATAITLGVSSIMKGTMIAGTALTLNGGANLEGRAMNQGVSATQITCDACTITVPAL